MTTPDHRPTDPDQLLIQVHAGRRDLERALDGISDEELMLPGMTGAWSGKDTLVHIARWDEFVANVVRHDRRDGTLYAGGYEVVIATHLEQNEIWAEEDRDVPLIEVRDRFAGAHAEVLTALDELPASEWDGEVVAWVNALIEHYPEHTPLILEWRARRAKASNP
jgi:hypothetical protein